VVKELEQQDVNGDTPLLVALLHGHVSCARVLAAAGASAAALRADDSTVLHVAASVAAAASFDPSLSSSSSRSPGGNLDMFSALIESGACSPSLMGFKNASGDNVYHVIARERNIQLLVYVASVTKDAIHVIAANAKGQSPLHVAFEGEGSADRLAVALELVNIAGSFATGAPRPLNVTSASSL
jgi:ankyrin repeat protein